MALISLLLVAVTAIGQTNFLNKAMMHFGNNEVVPVYYTTFTMASVGAGGLVYSEFGCLVDNNGDVDVVHVLLFFFGCCLLFVGVYLVASGRGDAKKFKGGKRLMESGPGADFGIQQRRRRSKVAHGLSPLVWTAPGRIRPRAASGRRPRSARTRRLPPGKRGASSRRDEHAATWPRRPSPSSVCPDTGELAPHSEAGRFPEPDLPWGGLGFALGEARLGLALDGDTQILSGQTEGFTHNNMAMSSLNKARPRSWPHLGRPKPAPLAPPPARARAGRHVQHGLHRRLDRHRGDRADRGGVAQQARAAWDPAPRLAHGPTPRPQLSSCHGASLTTGGAPPDPGGPLPSNRARALPRPSTATPRANPPARRCDAETPPRVCARRTSKNREGSRPGSPTRGLGPSSGSQPGWQLADAAQPTLQRRDSGSSAEGEAPPHVLAGTQELAPAEGGLRTSSYESPPLIKPPPKAVVSDPLQNGGGGGGSSNGGGGSSSNGGGGGGFAEMARVVLEENGLTEPRNGGSPHRIEMDTRRNGHHSPPNGGSPHRQVDEIQPAADEEDAGI